MAVALKILKGPDIYDLGLHEEGIIRDTSIYVMRVPGGWIYNHYYVGENDPSTSSVFVPMNDEFRGIKA